MNTIADMCDRGIVLHNGKATGFENIADAVAEYETL
jgi:ABC-type polysaccharide/polyol phosphate transport system ATPase subunit